MTSTGIHGPQGESQLPSVSLEDSLRSASRSDPGEAGDILYLCFEKEVKSLSYSPPGLPNTGPTGLQN